MRISTSVRATAIAVIGVVLIWAAPALGDGPPTHAQPSASAGGGDDGRIIIRRQGPLGSIESTPAAVLPSLSTSSAGAPDGFDWGDAAVGAGAALGVMALAAGAFALTARRGNRGTVPA